MGKGYVVKKNFFADFDPKRHYNVLVYVFIFLMFLYIEKNIENEILKVKSDMSTVVQCQVY